MGESRLDDLRRRFIDWLKLCRRRAPDRIIIRGYASADDRRRAEELIQQFGWEHLRTKK